MKLKTQEINDCDRFFYRFLYFEIHSRCSWLGFSAEAVFRLPLRGFFQRPLRNTQLAHWQTAEPAHSIKLLSDFLEAKTSFRRLQSWKNGNPLFFGKIKKEFKMEQVFGQTLTHFFDEIPNNDGILN